MFPGVVWLLAVLAVHHALAVTRGSLDFFGDAEAGLVFNDMLLRLLEGRFDVSPAVIRDEAFVHDGRSYTYFGLLPALVRLPLLPFIDLATVQVARLSCYVAIIIGLLAQARAVLSALTPAAGPAQVRLIGVPVLLLVGLSGPAEYLGPRPLVYHEALLWGLAWVSVFIAAIAQGLFEDGGRLSGRLLAVMALAAAACLLTRVSTGLGLYAALALVMMIEAGRRLRDGGMVALLSPGLLGPALLALLGVGAALAINHARWGDPFSFGDIRAQTLMEDLDRRLAVLDAYGTFSLRRLGLGLSYYVLPLWSVVWDGRLLFAEWHDRMYWYVEGPPASQLLLEPASLALAALGIGRLARPGPLDRPVAATAAAGLAVPAALVAIFLYLAFRYRAEFTPVLLLLGLIGLNGLAHRLAAGRLPHIAWLWALAVVQMVATQGFAILYKIAPLGPPVGVETLGWLDYYIGLWAKLGQAG